MKRLIPYIISAFALVATFGGITYASTPAFTSFQLSTTTPSTGYVLQTDGSGNHWVATSTLGFSGGGGSGTVTQINTTYPLLGGPITNTGTLSLAFGTTTPNIWSSLQTFTAGFISQASSTISALHLGIPLEVASGGTGSTTLTGILKGNGTGSVLTAIGDSDYQKPITLTTTGTSGASTFTGDVLNIPTYANTTYTAAYPITLTGTTFGTAFGTTTSNTFAGTQTFTNSPNFAVLGNGTVNSNGTLHTIYSTATSSLSVGTGLAYSGTFGSEIGGTSGTLTNTGVTSLTAGTGISLSGSTGGVTITATGGSGSGTVSTSSSETAGYFPMWTSTNGTPALLSGTSQLFQSGTSIGIGTTSPADALGITGGIYADGTQTSVFGTTGVTSPVTINSNTTLVAATTTKTASVAAIFVNDYEGTSASTIQGVNVGVEWGPNATANCTAGATIGGCVRNRYAAENDSTGHNTQTMSASAATIDVDGITSSSTNASAFFASAPVVAAGDLITNYYGLHVLGGAQSGTITNNYGVEVDALTAGTNTYGFYQAGTADMNYFAGETGIGTTSPNAQLSIGGNTVIGAATAGGTNGSLFLNGLATPAGAFLAVNPLGQVIATTAPSGGGSGTVTSISGSGGTTGLTLTGGPITTSGTLTLGGTLAVANGGTNATSFTTIGNDVYWNGTSLATAPLTSAITIPFASTTAESSTNLWDSALTSGQCVQAGALGLLTTTGSACGSGGGSAYPFAPGTENSIAVQATTTAPIADLTPGLALDVSVNGWYGIGGVLLAYASSTTKDTVLGINALNKVATTSASVHQDTAIGYEALQLATAVSNQDDTAIGYLAGEDLTSGINNTAVGAQAIPLITTGSSNAAFGFQAGDNANAAASNDTFIGYESDDGAASGAITSTTIVGSTAGASNSGNQNTYIGSQAGVGGTTGSQNVTLGYDGALPVAAGSGQLNIQNIIYGTGNTGTGVTLSTGNIGIGTTTPWRKFAVNGTVSLAGLTTASAAQSGSLCITATNEVVNDSVACATSARRYKNDIQDIPDTTALSQVLALQPVTYFFKPDFNGTFQSDPNYSRLQVGLVADDAMKVNPAFARVETATTTFEGKMYGVGTPAGLDDESIMAAMVGAIQAQQKEIQGLNGSVPVRSIEENWQWLAIAILVAWNCWLTMLPRR